MAKSITLSDPIDYSIKTISFATAKVRNEKKFVYFSMNINSLRELDFSINYKLINKNGNYKNDSYNKMAVSSDLPTSNSKISFSVYIYWFDYYKNT